MKSPNRSLKLFIALSVVALLVAFVLWPSNTPRKALEETPKDKGQVAKDLDYSELKQRMKGRRKHSPHGLKSTKANVRFVSASSSALSSSEMEGLERVEISETGEVDDDERTDQPDEALRFRLMQLKDETGRIPPDGLLKAKAHVAEMRAEQLARAQRAGKKSGMMAVASLTPTDWTWLGPGNIGGRIRSIVIDPNNANNMWVGSVGGGIWRTTNAGTSWSPVNDFLANLAVSTMVIDPSNPNIMYAGTGEFFADFPRNSLGFTPDGLQGLGVFKSTDRGVTWSQLPSTNPAAAAVCAGGPGANCAWSYVDRLAVASDGSILAATGTSIQRSVDGGATWTPGAGINAFFLDIDFDPANSLLAVVGLGGAAGYSIDGGQNWTLANFTPAINGGTNTVSTGGNRVELAYAPSNPSIVYAAVNQNNGELYR
ncbi:MAG TPA: sialidase family protein, partial [Pyrinomonadaceae bacterium]|nr:sialidase family protein [Pyrinomonadaceae bacterium]